MKSLSFIYLSMILCMATACASKSLEHESDSVPCDTESPNFLIASPAQQLAQTLTPEVNESLDKLCDAVLSLRPEFKETLHATRPLAFELAMRSVLLVSLNGISKLYSLLESPLLHERNLNDPFAQEDPTENLLANKSIATHKSHSQQFAQLIEPDLVDLNDTHKTREICAKIAETTHTQLHASREEIEEACWLIFQEINSSCAASLNAIIAESAEEIAIHVEKSLPTEPEMRTRIYTLLAKAFNLSTIEQTQIQQAFDKVFEEHNQHMHDDGECD